MKGESGFQLSGDAAERYERRVSPIMAPFVGALVDAMRLAPGEAVLDLACGTGFVAREVATRVGPDGHVAAVDVNPGMLVVAAAHGPAEPQVAWAQASADALPYLNDEFDVVVCQQGVQFFPDLDAALAEAARVVRPKGRFGATTWASPEGSPYFVAMRLAIEAIAGPEAASSFDTTFGCPARTLVSAMRRAGFDGLTSREITATVHLPPLDEFAAAHLAALPWGEDVAAAAPDGPAAYTRLLTDLLNPYITVDRGVSVPFTATLATATR